MRNRSSEKLVSGSSAGIMREQEGNRGKSIQSQQRYPARKYEINKTGMMLAMTGKKAEFHSLMINLGSEGLAAGGVALASFALE